MAVVVKCQVIGDLDELMVGLMVMSLRVKGRSAAAGGDHCRPWSDGIAGCSGLPAWNPAAGVGEV